MSSNNNFQQDFPTYIYKENNKDIVIEEYKAAVKTVESEEGNFTKTLNITVFLATAFGTTTISFMPKLFDLSNNIIPIQIMYILMLIFVLILSIFIILFFTDQQKSIITAKRKVIVLRRMLGLDYGNLNLVLPNNKVEGATNPFIIKMFSGWSSYISRSFYILLFVSSILVFYIFFHIFRQNFTFPLYQFKINVTSLDIFFTGIWIIIYICIFRISLFDKHDSIFFLIALFLSKLMRIKIKTDSEYIFYKTILSYHEATRLKIDFKNLKEFLIFIEDKKFYKHHGVSISGYTRALLGICNIKKRKSGGSTIQQQLFRTLFVSEYQKTIRRKILELICGFWINKVFSKEEILKMYICSVKFDLNCFGIIKAMNHFFSKNLKNCSKAQAFFLIERLSNTKQKLLYNKISSTIKSAKNQGKLSTTDIQEIIQIYKKAINEKKIIASQEDFQLLKNQLSCSVIASNSFS